MSKSPANWFLPFRLYISVTVIASTLIITDLVPLTPTAVQAQEEETTTIQCVLPTFSIENNNSPDGIIGLEHELRQSERIFADGSYYDRYPIYGEEGEQITLELVSDEFDTYLELWDQNGEFIILNNDSENSTNSRIEIELPYTGHYTVFIGSDQPNTTGSYTFSLQGERYYPLLFEGMEWYQASLRLADRGNLFDAMSAAKRSLENHIEIIGKCHGHTIRIQDLVTRLQQQQAEVEITPEEKAYLTSQIRPFNEMLIGFSEEEVSFDAYEILKITQNNIEIYHRTFSENSLSLAWELSQYAFMNFLFPPLDESKETALKNSVAAFQEVIDIINSRNWPVSEYTTLSSLASNVGKFLEENLSDYQSAEIWFLKAINYNIEAEAEFGDGSQDSVALLTKTYLLQNRYDEAIELNDRIVTYQRERNPFSKETAGTLVSAARLYRALGRPDQAELMYKNALEIYRRIVSDTPTDEAKYDVANTLHSLAVTIQDQGQYVSSREKLEEAYSMIEELSKERKYINKMPNFLNSLAENYRIESLTNIDKKKELEKAAEDLYLKAIKILREDKSSHGGFQQKEELAMVLRNLSHLYSRNGNDGEVEDLLLESIMLFEEELKGRSSSILSDLRSGVFLQGSSGGLSALPEIFYILALDQLGLSYADQGNYEDAISTFQKATSIFEARNLDSHPQYGQVLHKVGLTYLNKGDANRALQLFTQSEDILEENLSTLISSGTEAEKQAYISTLQGYANAIVAVNMQRTPENQQSLELALTTILRRKGRILDSVSSDFQKAKQQFSADELQMLDELNQTRSEVSELRFSRSLDISEKQFLSELQQLEAKFNQLSETLAQRSSELYIETPPISIEAVRATLPENTTLVEFVRYQSNDLINQPLDIPPTERYAAYVLADDGSIGAVDLGEAAPIDALVADFRINLRSQTFRTKTIARQLDELIMAPIRPLLGDNKHLLISPDSQLNLIPFAALVTENDRYLIEEDYQITYLTSGRDLLRLQLDQPSQQGPVILANPDYDNPGSGETVQIAQVLQGEEGEKGRGGEGENRRSVDISDFNNFDPLPGTAEEAEAIAPLLDNVTVLTQTNATENALKQLNAPSILHIATHGFFLEDVEFFVPPDNRGLRASIEIVSNENAIPIQPTPSNTENPLLRSGLALAGFNQRDSGTEDGVLTALEASGLNLYGTKLVVLSACDTGVGQVSTGEGVYGLRRAFVTAGAESQLMSLWQVSDYGTSALMELYYQNLKAGQGRSEALHNAQITLMNSGQYQHPYYWASFIFSGDWSPLEGI